MGRMHIFLLNRYQCARLDLTPNVVGQHDAIGDRQPKGAGEEADRGVPKKRGTDTIRFQRTRRTPTRLQSLLVSSKSGRKAIGGAGN